MTITELARRYRLSRSTLLYYDRVGVLRPSVRHANGYRWYTEADARRLQQVCQYRELGVPLRTIADLKARPGKALAGALERQLRLATAEIGRLRRRQRAIIALLQRRRLLEDMGALGREAWVAVLREAGFSEEDMRAWHRDFEQSDPEYHQRFLELLGLTSDRVAEVRRESRDRS